jgi:ubiquinol-cytochrome c reductase cytochrome b subunit
MSAERKNMDSSEQKSASGLWAWLNRRAGVDDLLKTALYEPIPGGARFAYVFGSGLLFIFISQVITGVFLALYYVPSADHAHTTVAYITKTVTAGSFLRSLHAYGSSAMVVVLLLHLSQTYIYGAYKGRREILWLSGCVLFALILGMAFTGYLLPWDQRAYFATAVGTNAASEIPGIGESVKQMMRGGSEMGTLTISRFFVAHVFLIPACILALVASHIYLFRRAGAAGKREGGNRGRG